MDSAKAMEQTTLRVRVRPQRFAVLLPWNATADQALKAIHIQTLLWGGRFGPLVPAGTSDEEIAITRQWLSDTSPDFVCGLEVDHDYWQGVSMSCCRPLGYMVLEGDPEEALFRKVMVDPISPDPLISHVLSKNPGMTESRFFHLDAKTVDLPGVLAAAVFGYLPRGRAKGVIEKLAGTYAEYNSTDGPSAFMKALTRTSRLTLFDAGSYGLESCLLRGEPLLPPTVFLVGNCGVDLACFWATRMQLDPMVADRVLPIVPALVDDNETVSNLTEWIRGYSPKANYCRVIASPDRKDEANRLARRLRPRLARTGIEHVDVNTERFESPVVIGKERSQRILVTKCGAEYRLSASVPSFREHLRQDGYWMLDFERDEDSKCSPGENVPPPFRVTAHEVLNSPTPPTATQSRIDPLRYSVDNVSLRVKKGEGMVCCSFPSGPDLIGEHLRECGLTPVSDDKRPLYESVIQRFGSLYEASQSCCSPFREMLHALMGKELLECQIRQQARLGNAKCQQPDASQVAGWYSHSPVRARLAQQRFQEYHASGHPSSNSPLNVLEYWSSKQVVQQVFRTPQCPGCRRRSWQSSIDLSMPLLCRNCGRRILVSGQLEIGYRLDPIVAAALQEGFAPIALTGQFLRNLTRRGFQWIPGFRFNRDKEEQDIDIVALCDGHLALVECKTLCEGGTGDGTWEKIEQQMTRMVEVARMCSAGVVFLASLAEEYPHKLQVSADSASTSSCSVHLLNRRDLEKGNRKTQVKANGKERERFMWIEDFVPQSPKRESRKRPGKRKLKL